MAAGGIRWRAGLVGLAKEARRSTEMRPQTLRWYAREAGFNDVEILPIENTCGDPTSGITCARKVGRLYTLRCSAAARRTLSSPISTPAMTTVERAVRSPASSARPPMSPGPSRKPP